MTTTPETEHVSIVTTSEPCWVVFVDGREKDHYGGGTGHFTRAEADDELDNDETVSPKQLNKPCITIACAQCGDPYDLDNDERAIYHFDTAEQALADVVGTDWTVRDGNAYCPEHPQEDDDQ